MECSGLPLLPLLLVLHQRSFAVVGWWGWILDGRSCSECVWNGGNFIFRLFEDSFNWNREIFLFSPNAFYVRKCFNRIKESELFAAHCTAHNETGQSKAGLDNRMANRSEPESTVQWNWSNSPLKYLFIDKLKRYHLTMEANWEKDKTRMGWLYKK